MSPVRYTEQSRTDLIDIWLHIATHDELVANRMSIRLPDARSLEIFPNLAVPGLKLQPMYVQSSLSGGLHFIA